MFSYLTEWKYKGITGVSGIDKYVEIDTLLNNQWVKEESMMQIKKLFQLVVYLGLLFQKLSYCARKLPIWFIKRKIQ